MRKLYEDFGKNEKGYTEEEYKKTVETIAGTSFDSFFSDYIWGTTPYDKQLSECFNYIACNLLCLPAKKYHERYFGFKVTELGGIARVSAVYPDSVAAKAGLWIGDEVIAVNDFQVKNDLAEWCSYFGEKGLQLSI